MNRALLCFLLFLALPGCLVVYGRTEVIRPEEQREIYRFEDEKAWADFHGFLSAFEPEEDDHTLLFFPILFLYLHETHLSPNALFNDHAAACDANGDKAISPEEATAYLRTKKEE